MKHEVKGVTLSCDCCHEEYNIEHGFVDVEKGGE